jgi:curved DNA-binding protein CbpA
MDEVRRAYAILGLAQGTSLREVRRRYLLLAKRWHPDRFASDRVAEATAAERMRSFNAAYHTLVERLGQRTPPKSPASPSRYGRRLTREEVERMVAAIGTEGPLDGFLNGIGWVGTRIEAVWAAAVFAVVAVRVAYLVLTLQFERLFNDLRHSPEAAFIVAVLLILGGREAYQRLVLRAHERTVGGPPASKDGLQLPKGTG